LEYQKGSDHFVEQGVDGNIIRMDLTGEVVD